MKQLKEVAPPSVSEDKVWVSYSRKVSIAKYESIDLAVGATVTRERGESLTGAIDRVAKSVREEHSSLLEAFREDQGV